MAILPPIAQATISACSLAIISNIIAQCIRAMNLDGNSSPELCESYTPNGLCANQSSFNSLQSLLNWRSIFEFALFAILNSPPNFLWQQFLESTFPSHTLHPSTSAIRAAAAGDDQALDESEKSHTLLEPQLDPVNTACKFFLDQSIGAALNTLAFSFAMAALRGEDWSSAVTVASTSFWPLMRAGWKLWPVVSACNFLFVRDVQMRSLVGNLAGMGWTVYLSLATPSTRSHFHSGTGSFKGAASDL